MKWIKKRATVSRSFLCFVQKRKIFAVFHKRTRCQNTDITPHQRVHGCAACDIFYDGVAAKLLAEHFDKFLAKFLVQIAQNAV